MPILSVIFGKDVRDKKPEQCEVIFNRDNPPFIKRCTNGKGHNLKVCKFHAKTVNYLDSSGKERTAYFNNIAAAEYFKRSLGSRRWLECNYTVKKA